MSLEIKKLKLELLKVQSAMAESDIRIDERRDEIKRIEENLALQTQRETELRERIEALEAKAQE